MCAVQVLEAAVIGLPHPKWTERPLLLVVPRPGQTPTKDAILAHLKVGKTEVPCSTVNACT